jgi:hypothetical protein
MPTLQMVRIKKQPLIFFSIANNKAQDKQQKTDGLDSLNEPYS